METVTIKLCFVSKWDVTKQPVMGIQPAAKFQLLSKITKYEKHSVQVVRFRVLFIQCSPYSRWGNVRRLAVLRVLAGHNALPRKNLFSQTDMSIYLTLSCNANAGNVLVSLNGQQTPVITLRVGALRFGKRGCCSATSRTALPPQKPYT